jgi:chemotaxis protein CheY-P-specific phosphatase CheC
MSTVTKPKIRMITMKKNKIVTTEDILLMLCQSVSGVLSSATNTNIQYSAMVQKINKTCLRPDFGCFVLFDGGFSGLVVTNFTSQAALEIYTNYMRNMGMPEEELAILHTSDEVGDVLGELMNQLVGDFTNKIRNELKTNITQNQPKMLAINKQVLISVDTNLDRPQARRVTFSTEGNNIFYLELAMDKTEFIQMEEFEVEDNVSPDSILENERNKRIAEAAPVVESNDMADDLLDELGI